MKRIIGLVAAALLAVALLATPANALGGGLKPTTLKFTSTPGLFPQHGTTYDVNVKTSRNVATTPVVISTSTPTVCLVNGSDVDLIAPGICTVVADQAAAPGYLAGHAEQTFRVY